MKFYFLLYIFFLLNLTNAINSMVCINNNDVLLCDKQNTCPSDYHICNLYDIDYLKRIDYSIIDKTYKTNIAIDNNGKCSLCSQYKPSYDETNYVNKNLYMITVSNIDTNINKSEIKCNINNKYIPLNTGILVNECYFCYCKEYESNCINICDYKTQNSDNYQSYINNVNNVNEQMNRYRLNDLYDCMGLKYDNTFYNTKNSCDNVHNNVDNVACCMNVKCDNPYCSSCLKYGEKEECIDCKEGSYMLNTNNRYTCHPLKHVKYICNNYYNIDYIYNTAQCLTCKYGYVKDELNYHDDVITQGICVCNDGYFGLNCDKSYDNIYCSNNGKYNIDTQKCNCNKGWSGSECNINSRFNCINGLYDEYSNICKCYYGYTGNKCAVKIDCVNGLIKGDVCICNNGFSGLKCDKFNPKESKKVVIEDSIETKCLYGISKQNLCECFPGYKGNNCDINICNNGYYSKNENVCICNEGWSGDYCNNDCLKECNYNGNKCNDNNICVCNDDWTGDFCNIINIENKNSIVLANSLIIEIESVVYNEIDDDEPIQSNVENIIIEITDCNNDNCVPFKLIDNNYENNLFSRLLQENNVYTILDLNNYIKPNEKILVIPENSYNDSYYSENGVIIIQNGIYSNYDFIVVDGVKSETLGSIKDNNVVFQKLAGTVQNSNNTVNSNSNNENNSIVNDATNYYKDLFTIKNIIYTCVGIAIIVIITLSIYKLCCCMKKRACKNKTKNEVLREKMNRSSVVENPVTINVKQPTGKSKSCKKMTDCLPKKVEDDNELKATYELTKKQFSFNIYSNSLEYQDASGNETMRYYANNINDKRTPTIHNYKSAMV